MLDVSLQRISFAYPRSEFRIDDLTAFFPKNSITAVVGAAGSGKSTLLRLISGHHKVRSGHIEIGAKDATALKPRRRPIFSSAFDAIPPLRWSVQHVLIAALRERKLDFEDRRREFELTTEKWNLAPILDRRLATLSPSERLRVRLAQIETLRPAIFIAERLLQDAAPGELPDSTREIASALRIIGSTVISEIASLDEISMCDRVVVMDRGSIVQVGTPSEVYSRPQSEAAARATGEVSPIPVTVRGNSVESTIGTWEAPNTPFQGEGVALARPDDFQIAAPGEDSDFIFAIEQASFRRGMWVLRGFLTSAHLLTVTIPASVEIHKGKLLPLRAHPANWLLVQRPQTAALADAIPTLRDSR